MSKNLKILLLMHGLMGFVMWYAVEKIFLQSIGVSILQMGFIASSYIAISAIFNIPTGIFADKFGRKSALIFATIFLFASTLITGISTNFTQYLIGAILWGLSFTTQNGAFGAIVYDELKSTGHEKQFIKYKSYGNSIWWLAIFASSFFGAFIGSHIGLREVFYFTLIPNILSIVACLFIQEPKFHSRTEELSNFHMISRSFKTILGSKLMIRLTTIFIALQILSWTYNEYDQLYFIALGFGIFGTGILSSFSGLAQACGAFLGGKITKLNLIFGLFLTLGLSGLLYIFTNSTKVLAGIFFLIMIALMQITFVNSETKLQHEISSKIRATAMSSLSMLNDLIMIIIFLSFGIIGQKTNSKNGFLAITIFTLIFFVAGYTISFRAKRYHPQTQ